MAHGRHTTIALQTHMQAGNGEQIRQTGFTKQIIDRLDNKAAIANFKRRGGGNSRTRISITAPMVAAVGTFLLVTRTRALVSCRRSESVLTIVAHSRLRSEAHPSISKISAVIFTSDGAVRCAD